MTTNEPPGPPAQASDDDAARRPPSGPRPPLSLRSLLSVAAIGCVTTVVAYLISGGSIPIFVAVMVGLGVLPGSVPERGSGTLARTRPADGGYDPYGPTFGATTIERPAEGTSRCTGPVGAIDKRGTGCPPFSSVPPQYSKSPASWFGAAAGWMSRVATPWDAGMVVPVPERRTQPCPRRS
jgi:hypothetical protein